MNIILIGFMGSGKTTLARYLSHIRKLKMVDMDELILKKTQSKTMHELFEKGGELLLREEEIAIAKKIASKKNHVIATGGGVVLNKIIFDYFKKNGSKIIYLHASYETVVKRVEKDLSRPLFQLENVQKLYEFRLPLYNHFADAIVDVNSDSIEEIAKKIDLSLKEL